MRRSCLCVAVKVTLVLCCAVRGGISFPRLACVVLRQWIDNQTSHASLKFKW